MTRLTIEQVLEADLADWRPVAGTLRARFLTKGFTTGVELVTAVAEAAEEMNHHPDVTLTWPFVDIALTTHDEGNAITELDVELARRVSALAAERGIAADPGAPTVLELALDTAHKAAVGPFWAAVLTGDPANVDGDDVVDPTGRVPLLWLQSTEEHDEPRQRFHLDVWVAHDQAQTRIDAALATGGRLVDDSQAPSFVVLADVEGNKACICTSLDRA